MKRKILAGFTVVLLLAGIAGLSEAALVVLDNADGVDVVYDDVNQQYWIRDLTLLYQKSYSEQMADIDSWNADSFYLSASWGQWRMAGIDDIANLWSYTAEEICTSFLHNKTTSLLDKLILTFSGRLNEEDLSADETSYYILNALGYEDGSYYTKQLSPGNSYLATYLDTGAWVLADAVPIPGTTWLLIAGLLGLTVVRSRSRKQIRR